MSRLKLNVFEQKIVNLSMSKRWLFLAIVGGLLLLVKTIIVEMLLPSVSSEQTLSLVSDYHFRGDFLIFVIFISIIYWLMSAMKKQLNVIQEDFQASLQQDSAKNNFQLQGNNELVQFVKTISHENELAQKSHLVREKSTDELNSVTESLTTCMEIITESMNEEFAQIEQLATAMNEMTATVKEVANNANSASSSTTEAAGVAEEGSQFVDATITTINSLSSNIGSSADAVNEVELKVGGIGSVVDTIRSISEQTNLLALNAAIEAARAGEAGRGFAVVADEVRNLAKRTQDATIEIQGMIEELQNSAQDANGLMGKSVREADVGVEQVTQAGTKLSGIVEKIGHISDMNYQISSAAEEQTTVANDINRNLDEVKEIVEGSVTIIKEVTEMANMISDNVHDLIKAN